METRVHPRVKTKIGVRFLVNGEVEGEGVSINLSAGGLAILTEIPVEIGDKVVVYPAGGARFEGKVARLLSGGFAVALEVCKEKEARIRDAVDALFAREEVATEIKIDQRRSMRINCSNVDAVTYVDGKEVPGKIKDLSLTGLSFQTPFSLLIGQRVTIGQTHGVVVRKEGDRYGVAFDGSEGISPMQAPVEERQREAKAEEKPAETPKLNRAAG